MNAGAMLIGKLHIGREWAWVGLRILQLPLVGCRNEQVTYYEIGNSDLPDNSFQYISKGQYNVLISAEGQFQL